MVANEVFLNYKDWHIDIHTLESLPYWQYEMIVKKVTEVNKKEEENQEKENEKWNSKSPSSEVSRMRKSMDSFKTPSFSNSMPSMPSMPKI